MYLKYEMRHELYEYVIQHQEHNMREQSKYLFYALSPHNNIGSTLSCIIAYIYEAYECDLQGSTMT